MFKEPTRGGHDKEMHKEHINEKFLHEECCIREFDMIYMEGEVLVIRRRIPLLQL